MIKMKLYDFGVGDTLRCPSCDGEYLHVICVDHTADNVSIAYECETCDNNNILEIHNFKGHKTIGWYEGQ
jgi:hypothetical protein